MEFFVYPSILFSRNSEGKLVVIALPDEKQDKDETYELLRANERLARIVAECKLQSQVETTLSVEQHINASNNRQQPASGNSANSINRPLTGEWKRIDNLQMSSSMIELETVEPLPDINLRPIKIRTGILSANASANVSAGGDSVEVSIFCLLILEFANLLLNCMSLFRKCNVS